MAVKDKKVGKQTIKLENHKNKKKEFPKTGTFFFVLIIFMLDSLKF